MTSSDGATPQPVPPESRTVQANERTLLAWMRTGISLITFGFVIARLGVWVRMVGIPGHPIPGAAWIGALFVLMGAILDSVGIARYVMFHRAFMKGTPTPTGVAAVLAIAVAITSLGAVLGVFVVLSIQP